MSSTEGGTRSILKFIYATWHYLNRLEHGPKWSTCAATANCLGASSVCKVGDYRKSDEFWHYTSSQPEKCRALKMLALVIVTLLLKFGCRLKSSKHIFQNIVSTPSSLPQGLGDILVCSLVTNILLSGLSLRMMTPFDCVKCKGPCHNRLIQRLSVLPPITNFTPSSQHSLCWAGSEDVVGSAKPQS